MATSSTLPDQTPDHWESNATPNTSDTPSPDNTPQSPYCPMSHPPSTSTFPIKTSLIPPSMISMNGIPLPPTLQIISSKSKHHYPGTNTSKSRRKTRINRIANHASQTHDTSRSRSRDRTSKHRKNKEKQDTVCDLTTNSTPMSSQSDDDDSDSDIEIIDKIPFPKEVSSSNTVINTVPHIENNFERYTMNGIGGKLLRKSGWNGDIDTLYETNGPIAQSKKYGSLQRNFVWKKNGLGYNEFHNKRMQRALIYPVFNKRRIPLPQTVTYDASNTMDTAIEIEDDDDEEVQILDKRCVTQKRLNSIAFNDIISSIKEEKEHRTLKCISKQFSGSKKRIAVTKMVISIKDSYSQTKIEVPVRGRHCKHLQPFDAKCFLLRTKKYQKCTQCNMKIDTKDLIKMVYFNKIFDDIKCNYAKGIEQIEIMRNGEWKVVDNKQNNNNNDDDDEEMEETDDDNVEVIHIKKAKHSVIVLSSDDEEEIDEPDVVDLLDSSESDSDDEYEEISSEGSDDNE